MKDSLRDNLKQLFGASGNTDVINQIFMVLDLPDEQFDPVYPKMKESLKDVMNNVDMQKEIISTSRQTPLAEGDIEEAKEFINSFIEEINNDETLSTNKKDMLITLIEQSMNVTFDLAQNPRERIGVKIQLINEDAKLPEYARSPYFHQRSVWRREKNQRHHKPILPNEDHHRDALRSKNIFRRKKNKIRHLGCTIPLKIEISLSMT